MKKIILVGIIALLVVAGVFVALFIWNRRGDVSEVKTSITSTERHSEDEIREAMDIVKSHFAENFTECQMTDLWYDDARSKESESSWNQQYGSKESIVLLSNYKVGDSGGDGSLNPNETYTDWQWILVKRDNSWILKTWGY